MHELFILIADGALREAVVEQISAAKLLQPRCVETLANLLKMVGCSESCIVVIDADSLDKKGLLSLHDRLRKQAHTALIILGTMSEAEGVGEIIAKPFRLGHLITRLRYYLETAPLLRDRVVLFGPYRLEVQNRRVLISDQTDPIKLTEKETALLVYLADSPQPVTRQDILASIWGYDERIDTHTLETHIYQLRRKLDRDNEAWLIFEAGAYRMVKGTP